MYIILPLFIMHLLSVCYVALCSVPEITKSRVAFPRLIKNINLGLFSNLTSPLGTLLTWLAVFFL